MDVSRLQDMVKHSGAIFLLNAMRKSRWLPTVMTSYLGKTLINVALGLDG